MPRKPITGKENWVRLQKGKIEVKPEWETKIVINLANKKVVCRGCNGEIELKDDLLTQTNKNIIADFKEKHWKCKI